MHGIDGMRMITTSDFSEAVVLAAATRRAVELADERDEALAVRIRNQLTDAWNKGQK